MICNTAGVAQGSVSLGGGGVTTTGTALMAQTRLTARPESSGCVPWRRGSVITAGVSTPPSGVTGSLTARTELTKCSATSTAQVIQSFSAASRSTASTLSGGVTERGTAVTAVTRGTVLPRAAVRESSPAGLTGSVSALSGGVTGSRSVLCHS